ncbi:hypothetical protein, partial [Pseudomonas aeruginosa]
RIMLGLMLSAARTIRRLRAARNIGPIMRKPDPLPVPQHLIDQATLYAPSRDPLDAVCYVLNDYPKLVADIRHLRRRLADLDQEGADMDVRIEALQSACRAILEL